MARAQKQEQYEYLVEFILINTLQGYINKALSIGWEYVNVFQTVPGQVCVIMKRIVNNE